jgi:hypothetical protein
MSTYRWLQDGVGPSGHYFHAGDIVSTSDVGGLLPANWVPPGAVEPLDNSAVAAFYAAGPQFTPLVRQQWSGVPVSPPATYWRAIPNTNPTMWQLTGLGSGLPPIGQ